MDTILIIEDEQDIRENISEILELSGYLTLVAGCGKEGVKMAKTEIPDLILCDVMMPELDGFGVLKILNADPNLINTPFIFLTAKSEKSDFRKGMGLGADDYITKPFDDVQLLETIEFRLNKSKGLEPKEEVSKKPKHFINEAQALKDLDHLMEDKERRKYNKKDEIFTQGNYPKYVFYLISGQVKTVQHSDFGKELITNIIGAGELFGYLPHLLKKSYSETSIALENSMIALIPLNDFDHFLQESSDYASIFLTNLGKIASFYSQQMVCIAYSSVRKKLANALLLLVEKNDSLTLKITRDDLASLTGSAKETITRTLTDFKNEEIVSVNGSEITVMNKSALAHMPQ